MIEFFFSDLFHFIGLVLIIELVFYEIKGLIPYLKNKNEKEEEK